MISRHKKRLETHDFLKAYVPKEITGEFRKVVSNFQGWLIEKMKEEVEKK